VRQIGRRQYKLTQIRKKQAKDKSFWKVAKFRGKIKHHDKKNKDI